MTVRELKELLDNFPDTHIVFIPDSMEIGYTQALHVSCGVNEFDNCIYIDDYEE